MFLLVLWRIKIHCLVASIQFAILNIDPDHLFYSKCSLSPPALSCILKHLGKLCSLFVVQGTEEGVKIILFSA